MSRRADCWDNAPMESFFASLKKELVHGEDFAMRAEARTAIFKYIEVFYNVRVVIPRWGTSPQRSTSKQNND
jgi:transposase InsO family protein